MFLLVERRKSPFRDENDTTTYIRQQVSKDPNFFRHEHGEDYLDTRLQNETRSYSDRNETTDHKTKIFRAVGGRSILGRSLACS